MSLLESPHGAMKRMLGWMCNTRLTHMIYDDPGECEQARLGGGNNRGR